MVKAFKTVVVAMGTTLIMSTTVAVSADWASRSTSPGVTMATNFDVSSDVFDFAIDPPENYAWDTGIKRSGGGSLKILIPDSEAFSGHDWWRWLSDDMEPFGSAESGLRDEYYISYAIYMPADYFNWIFVMTPGGSKKFSIISQKPSNTVHPVTRASLDFSGSARKGSSVPNEIVLNDGWQEMFPMLYIKARGRSASAFVFNDQPNRFDFSLFNAVDEGPKSGTPLAYPGDGRDQTTRDWVARYGPHYSYAGDGWGSGLTQGTWRTSAVSIHPDPIAGGKAWRPGWNYIKMRIKFPSTWLGNDGLLEFWMFHDGDPDWTKLLSVPGNHPTNPFLIDDADEIANGVPYNHGVDGWYHVGVWLTPFRTGGQPETGLRPDTFIIYDEIIVSTSDIDAPTGMTVIRPKPPTNLTAD